MPTHPKTLARAKVMGGLLFLGACAAAPGGGEDAGTDGGTSSALGMNDVSILYPIPPRTDAPGYLKPSDDGGRGQLLPRAYFDEVGGFPVTTADTLEFARLRTVAIRFDGCGGPRGACIPMVRLVMQPIDNGGVARDSALHLFYRLTAEELEATVGELRRLRALAPGAGDGPLDVHPGLVSQGVTGAYGAALRELVLSIAGEENLFKLTFFLRAPPLVEVWFMGGFDIDAAGNFTALDIVGVGQGNQQVIRTEVSGGYDYELNPVSATPEDARPFLTSADAAAATEQERHDTMAAFLRIENPVVHPVDDLSCAECHIATYVTAEARKAFGFENAAFPDAYTSTRDLTVRGTAAATPSSLRAFGYFREFPMISNRTVNETAAVLDYLETAFPAP